MIKIVPDTNLIISSFLGHGGPKRWIINLALEKKLVLYGSATTYEEFLDVISRDQFKQYLEKQIYTREKLDYDFKTFISIVDTENVYSGEKITADSDDDEYFRVAKASGAKIIISNDHHLHDVGKFDGVSVFTPEKFMGAYIKIIAKTERPS